MKPEYLVSACLAGECCRYDGKSSPHPKVMELVREGRAVPFCPECASGLPTPRIPAEISGSNVKTKDGRDVTEAFELGAEKALTLCRKCGIKKAILKSKSPSCGTGFVYSGEFDGKLVEGDGLTAKSLKEHHIKVMDEQHIDD